MSYLQDVSFLDTFPDRANIVPSFYSIPSERNAVWTNPGGAWSGLVHHKPIYCDRNRVAPPGHPATDCFYVCLIPPTAYTSVLPIPNVTMGMIGHYYMIDAHYGPIIHIGFPMNNPYSGMDSIKGQADYDEQLTAYFPNDNTNPNYKFSRHGTQFDTTYPYIFCFTTCCLTIPCPFFYLFLHYDKYRNTFWLQGFRDFTTLLSADPLNPANTGVSRVLSPVLHVVMGSMLSEPDFYLLSLRYNILNVEPLKNNFSSNPVIDEYTKSTQVLMTLGTKEKGTSIYQPSIDPYPRNSAVLAFKSFRDKIGQVNMEYKRRIVPEHPDNVIKQRSIVRDKVQKKIMMIQFIAYIFYSLSLNNTQELERILTDNGVETRYPNIRTKFVELVTEIRRLRTFLGLTNPTKEGLFRTNIGSLNGINLDDLKSEYMKAFGFIDACPSVAATAVIQYYSSQILAPTPYRPFNITEFEEDLIDYAILCLKKNWLGGIKNNAYETDTTVFGDVAHRRLYYLNTNGEFIYMGDGNFNYFDPSNPRIFDPSNPRIIPRPITDLYVHTSSFDEVKREIAEPPTLQTPTVDYSVTVLTLANIYRLDCYYKKIPGNIVKSMSIIYQVSGTVVYTRDVNPKILQAMDMQKIPLSFLPDLPDVLTDDKIPAVLRGKAYDPLLPFERRKPTPRAQNTTEATLKLQDRQKRLAIPNITVVGGTRVGEKRNRLQHQSEIEYRQDLSQKNAILDEKLNNNRNKKDALDLLESELTRFKALPAEGRLYSFLTSGYTSCATHRRVASYGGFFAGKMMDYFFEQYRQLPFFLNYFDSYLRICIQYATTALIYDAKVPPYNLIQPQQQPPGDQPLPPPSFTLPFFQHFKKMSISFFAGVPHDDPRNADYIKDKLQQKTNDIKAISEFLTKDFMIDEGADDDIQYVVDYFSQPSASSDITESNATISTTSSTRSEIFCSFDLENITSSDALCVFLTQKPLENSECGDDDYQHLSDDDDDDDDNDDDDDDDYKDPKDKRPQKEEPQQPPSKKNRVTSGGNNIRLTTVAATKRNIKYNSRSSPKRKSKSRHKRNSKVTNKTFCRKRKSYLSRKPFKKQTLRKGVKR
jgi:hypothetical protein